MRAWIVTGSPTSIDVGADSTVTVLDTRETATEAVAESPSVSEVDANVAVTV